jgi:hypothetical protein
MAVVQSVIRYPTSYVSDDYSYASATNITNAYAGSSNTTYAQINLTTGSGAETYIYYTFDVPNIPDNAVICEVACTVKAMISNQQTTRISSRTVQLYSGTVAKGSSIDLTNKPDTLLSLSSGDWTKDELSNIRLKLYAKRGSSATSTSYYIRFNGATLTIKYVIPEIIPIVGNTTINSVSKTITGGRCNIGGVWKNIVKSYANVNGVWTPTWKQREISFTWKKYTAITDTVYELFWAHEDAESFTSDSQWRSSERYSEFVGKKIYSTYSFDPKTEKITLSGYLGTVGDFDSVMSYIPNYDERVYLNKYDENNTKYSMFGLLNVSNVSDMFHVIYSSSSGETTETYGTYIEDVTSSEFTAYPENGKHTDGYWYIRQ